MSIVNGVLYRNNGYGVNQNRAGAQVQDTRCTVLTKRTASGLFDTLKNTCVAAAGFGFAKEIWPSLVTLANNSRNLSSSFRLRYDSFWNTWVVHYTPSIKYHLCNFFSRTLASDIECLAQEGGQIIESGIQAGANLNQRWFPGIIPANAVTNTQKLQAIGRYVAAELTAKKIWLAINRGGLPILSIAAADVGLEKMLGSSITATVARSLITGALLSATCTSTGVAAVPALAIYAGSRFVCTISLDAFLHPSR
jgi:hypothetical protein